MIRCSQPRNAKAKQHFESFRPIFRVQADTSGPLRSWTKRDGGMFSWTTLPTCHICHSHLPKKKNVASVEKQSSIAIITFNHSMTLSSGTACDTVLRASLLSPPELWHVAANSMHHGTCSFTWGPRTDSWAFHNRSTHNSYQAYIKLHAEVNAHQFLVSKLLKINQSLTLKASRRFTWLCELLRQWPTI